MEATILTPTNRDYRHSPGQSPLFYHETRDVDLQLTLNPTRLSNATLHIRANSNPHHSSPFHANSANKFSPKPFADGDSQVQILDFLFIASYYS